MGSQKLLKMAEEQRNSSAEMDSIKLHLDAASEYDLEVEVVHAALSAMKENPNLSINAAIVTGYNEWVK